MEFHGHDVPLKELGRLQRVLNTGCAVDMAECSCYDAAKGKCDYGVDCVRFHMRHTRRELGVKRT